MGTNTRGRSEEYEYICKLVKNHSVTLLATIAPTLNYCIKLGGLGTCTLTDAGVLQCKNIVRQLRPP